MRSENKTIQGESYYFLTPLTDICGCCKHKPAYDAFFRNQDLIPKNILLLK